MILFSVDDILKDAKSPWFSLYICYVILLLGGVQFSIYFTSMWPYLLSVLFDVNSYFLKKQCFKHFLFFLSQLDPDVNLYFYGFVISSFSFGQMLSSPLFGYWNQKTKSTRYPVMFGMMITSVGNLLYALLPTIGGSNSKWLMLVARFLVGLGSG